MYLEEYFYNIESIQGKLCNTFTVNQVRWMLKDLDKRGGRSHVEIETHFKDAMAGCKLERK